MENEYIVLKIEDISTQGEGIGKADGLVIFIPGTFPGDEVKIQITEIKGRIAKAQLIELIAPSEDRVEPLCKYADKCGGCELMGLSYEAQLRWKQAHVESTLKHLGGLENPKVMPIKGMEGEPLRYRNKAEFAIQGNRAGYYERGSHKLLEIDDCIIQNESVIGKLQELKETQKPTQKFFTRLVVRTSRNGDVMTILEDRDGGWRSDRRILKDIQTGLKVEVSPMSFYQVNPAQTEKLYGLVKEYAQLTGTERVLDLYCGAGSIGLSLADKAEKVIGVESVHPAILDANRNAVINGIVNAFFVEGKAEDVVKIKLQGVKADVVIVDPPRAGCKPELLDTVTEIDPKRLIYVSCNPATLARDIKYLSAKGYQLIEATPVDMFPHTLHVETVCVLTHFDVWL